MIRVRALGTCLLAAIVVDCTVTPGRAAAAPAPLLNGGDYTAASAILGSGLQTLIKNDTVEPHWLGDTGKFWYQRDGDHGPEFVLVDKHGTRRALFDHQLLALALRRDIRPEMDIGDPSADLSEVQISDDLRKLEGRLDGSAIACDLEAMRCQTMQAGPHATDVLVSPAGSWDLFGRDSNLILRDRHTGQERALTADGTLTVAWSKLPDHWPTTIARRKAGQAAAPYETFWSPDERFLIAPLVDDSRLGVDPFLESVPTDGSRRPIVHEIRQAIPGDAATLSIKYFVFDLQRGTRIPIALPAGYRPGLCDALVFGWSRSRQQAFLLSRSAGSRSVAVFRLDLVTGALQRVHEETSSTRVETNSVEYNAPNIRVLADGRQLVWYSDRSGYGHLYLYDAQTGRQLRALTQGAWQVTDLLAVDEHEREIYFTAGGREPGRDPYFRHLYRVSLDRPQVPQLLTAPDAEHDFPPAPSAALARFGVIPPARRINAAAGIFVDTWSTVSSPPATALRSTRDGHLIAILERADISRMRAAGWAPPIRERVKAADGVTDIYATYYAPANAVSGQKYPVIDAAYGGPQLAVAARAFSEVYNPSSQVLNSTALTRLGFAVVTIDGRGTPMRSRAFRDAGYTAFTQLGVDDHVAAIRQLGERHPEMDLDRVGVTGWSWGGTFSAQAILSRPEFYRVCVTIAGVYDYAAMYDFDFDNMIGPPVYANGSSVRTTPDESPVNWRPLEVTALAPRLTGKMMIVYGDLDENVPSRQAQRLIDALTRAHKSYDLLYLPNRAHSVALDPYVIKRRWDYFLEHLRGIQPLPDFVVPSGEPAPRG